MQISHLLLKDFGKFDTFECDFSPGLNIIKGPNEAGKSTIVEALTAALFLDPKKSDRQTGEIKRWGGENAPVLEAILNVGGKHYKLIKDFGHHKSNLEGDDLKLAGDDAAAVDEWLSDQTGIPSEEIFKATACVAQGGITHIEDSIEAIKDKLESLVTGGREDRAGSDVIKKIDDRIVQVTLEISRTDSLTEELDYNINKLNRDIQGLRSKMTDLVQVETAYKNVCDDHKNRKEKFACAQEAKKVKDQEKELLEEREEYIKKLSEAGGLHKEVEGLKKQISDMRKVTPDELREVEEASTAVGYYRHEKDGLEREHLEAIEELDGFKVGVFGPAISLLGVLVSGSITAVHTANLFPQYYPEIWYVLAGSVSILLLGSSIWNSRKQKRKMLSKNADKALKKYNDIVKNLEVAEAEADDLLKKYKVSSVEEMKRHLWQYEELDKKFKDSGKEYSKLMAGKSLEELEKRLTALGSELETMSKEKGNLSESSMEPEELERERLIINEIEERTKDLERERKVLFQQIESAEGGSELLACYLERKSQIKERVEALKAEVKILGITKDCIDEARQNALKSKLEVLNGTTSDILNTLTSGKYSKVRFDRSNLKFEVWAEEKNDWVDPETVLSSGTIDQIYLSARLALADLVSEHKNTLFVLDDPFSGYDNQRLENVMGFLKGMSSDHQILLLTSRDHYDRWADSTISL
ncbi:MAG: AAA family ATPase [Candidatus Zixiibacteriota bacterium]|nr:MAG: AAA family ATPase [candidate division Zixibacteria bacterium]